MAESVPPKAAGILKKKVAGIPVVYLAAGFVVILAFFAWKMQPAPEAQAEADAAATDEESDAAIPSGSGSVSVGGSLYPVPPNGTVVVAPQQPEVAEPEYEDNSTWMRKAVTFLISKGKNPGEAQLAMQHYLAGADLTYAEGEMRDMAIRELGLPPDSFDAGKTAPKPPPPKPGVPDLIPDPVVKPFPSTTVPKTTPKPTPKTVAPPTVVKSRFHIVRSGENLTVIARRYGTTWQRIYAANKSVIGSNPNLIKPGQRLRIP